MYEYWGWDACVCVRMCVCVCMRVDVCLEGSSEKDSNPRCPRTCSVCTWFFFILFYLFFSAGRKSALLLLLLSLNMQEWSNVIISFCLFSCVPFLRIFKQQHTAYMHAFNRPCANSSNNTRTLCTNRQHDAVKGKGVGGEDGGEINSWWVCFFLFHPNKSIHQSDPFVRDIYLINIYLSINYINEWDQSTSAQNTHRYIIIPALLRFLPSFLRSTAERCAWWWNHWKQYPY